MRGADGGQGSRFVLRDHPGGGDDRAVAQVVRKAIREEEILSRITGEFGVHPEIVRRALEILKREKNRGELSTP